jgi:hypothetical protein
VRAQVSGPAKPSSSVDSLAKPPQDFTDLLIELCEGQVEFLLALIANKKSAGRYKDLAGA